MPAKVQEKLSLFSCFRTHPSPKASWLVAGLVVSGKFGLWAQGSKPVELGFEWIDCDDVSLLQTSLVGDLTADDWETSVSFSYGHYTMDYEPVSFDFNGRPARLSERNLALSFNTRKSVRPAVTFMAGAGVYDGFTNYRSVWLDEYYRQQFSDLGDTPGADNYVEANPKGINGTLGGRWEYRPGTGFAQLDLSFLRDDVSPGYEIDFEGLRKSPLTLNTGAVSLSTENILSKRVRSHISVRAADTTGRSIRYAMDGTLYVALGNNWIGRLNAGGAIENPEFEAVYAGVAVEQRVGERFSWYMDVRQYEDTGEIENALLFTSAAPGLPSTRFGLGIRYVVRENLPDKTGFRLRADPGQHRLFPESVSGSRLESLSIRGK